MTLLLAMTGWSPEPWLDRFRRFLPTREVVTLDATYDPAAIHYAATWKHPPGSLSGLPNLRAIFSLGAGVDHLVSDTSLPDLPVLRVVDGDLTARMSEYVVLHCLRYLRRQPQYDARQRQSLWEDDRDQPAARDVRVGVLGLGVLGSDAIRKLAVMGFDVAGWSRSPKTLDGVACYAGPDALGAFLARTDILVALLPLTDATRGLLDRALFRQLARDGRLGGPMLINAGRGGLQNEADLLACLDDGTLAAATLDVFGTEPLPAASRFWLHPRVTLTPHNAAVSDPDATASYIAGLILARESGSPWADTVDLRAGY